MIFWLQILNFQLIADLYSKSLILLYNQLLNIIIISFLYIMLPLQVNEFSIFQQTINL